MRIKVAGAALNQTPLDWSGNRQRIEKAIASARAHEAHLLCLPEMCITGYGCEDVFFNPHMHEKAQEVLMELVPKTQGMLVTLGLPMMFQGSLFNCVAVVADGKLCGIVPKKFLAGDGVHYEPRWFKAWPTGQIQKIQIQNMSYPIGDLHFDLNGLKIGFEICEEAWVAQRTGANLAQRGVDLIFNPSASHFAFGKSKIRQRFVSEGSRAFNVAYVYANLLGNESGRIIFDGDVLIADGGQLIAQCERFSFNEIQVTSAIVDIDRNRVLRSRNASHLPDFSQKNDLGVEVDFSAPEMDLNTKAVSTGSHELPSWENSDTWKEEEFTRAIALGLFDFLRKSRQNGFVISLSGGVDSAAVTLLSHLALRFAEKSMGFPALKQRLSSIPFVKDCENLSQVSARMITTAYQATENSSKETLKAAQEVAKEAQAVFHLWSVDAVLGEYMTLAETALGEKLTWQKHDAALQNIQARARGPGIWVLANVKSALLLATSNRSEAAVGYATMDGDTCGGISPIGGIDKNFLRQWAHWMKDVGPAGIGAFPSLGFVLSRAPTAELRPLSENQTDEDDLMPYEVLDAIEKLAIRDKKSPLEAFQIIQTTALKHPKMNQWVAKFFKLWCRNQWKRERYAPAFHLDDESLDPKTWCRFPILMSGFEEELAELEQFGGRNGI